MRTIPRSIVLLTGVPFLAAALQAQAKPSAVLDRAIKAAGGESQLKEYHVPRAAPAPAAMGPRQ